MVGILISLLLLLPGLLTLLFSCCQGGWYCDFLVVVVARAVDIVILLFSGWLVLNFVVVIVARTGDIVIFMLLLSGWLVL